tara:strand:- start:1180 stop:1617 length:438 start_codon:yes stop_codon:yes gene_type:complete
MDFDAGNSSVNTKEIVKIVRTKKGVAIENEPVSDVKTEKELTEKKMISELKKIMKENDKLENLIEKGRDKNTDQKIKLEKQVDALKIRKKQLQNQFDAVDTDATIFNKIEEFKKLRSEMNVDKIQDKIDKLQKLKDKYKSQLKML